MKVNIRRQFGKRILVCGARGMVGSSILESLKRNDPNNSYIVGLTRDDVDFRNASATLEAIEFCKPDYIYICAAKVGGIAANSSLPFEFVTENSEVQNSIFSAIQKIGCQTALFLGSSCIYPKFASQPIKESELLSGPLESTNEAYAIAKICGLIQAKYLRLEHGIDVRSVMPTNLYGPGDNFDLNTSHVVPALLSKFRTAILEQSSNVTIWGSGSPRREFLHVKDFAEACIELVDQPESTFWGSLPENVFHMNVGSGQDIAISELAELIKEITGFEGSLHFDTEKPDGTPKKLLDVSILRSLGWKPRIHLREGLKDTYEYLCARS